MSRLRAVFDRLLPSGTTTQQTIRSGMWVLSMNVSDRALQLVMVVVLANLLAPADFGLFGIGLLGVSALKRVSQLGLNEALIYERDDDVDAYLNTAMTLRIVRGVVVAGALAVAAPAVASLLGDPRATPVIRAVALSPLLVAFHNPGVVYFRKDLDFHKQFLYSTSGSLTRFVVGVGVGVLTRSVWALVAAFLAADLARLVTSYVAHDHRPVPALDRSRAREMVRYGKWITGDSIVYFLQQEGDDVVVAWLLTPATLGFYQLAFRLSNAPATEVSDVVRQVTFPAFSTLQDDRAAMRAAFFKTLRVTTLVSFPMAVGIAAVAPVFVRAFLGPAWTPVVPVVQILAVHGLFMSITSSYSAVWRAVGRPDYSTKVGLVRVALMAVLIVPVTTAYGIVGTAALVVGLFAVPLFELDTYLLVQSLETTWTRVFTELAYPAVAGAGMGAAVVAVERTLTRSPLVEFAVLVPTGIVVYAGLVAILEFGFGWGLENEVRAVSRALLD